MTRVAIACQGGGSHTAFTAGFLQHVLANWDDEDDLVGLSGTSGGALNAVAAWYGLATDGPDRAVELLDAVWADIAAADPIDRMANASAVWTRRLQASGVPVPEVSPYLLPSSAWAETEFRSLLERHVDFERVRTLCADPDRPALVVGTVNVNAGEFETFVDEAVTADAVLASAAIPEVFRAVEIDDHYHWDGLFSQNPPVTDLMRGDGHEKPEELWVVQINPQRREELPTTSAANSDRRNELAGNISLNQELAFIERVNDWIDAGHLPESEFSRVDVHRIEMGRALHCSTKTDRSPGFIDEMLALGEERAAEFLAERP